MINIIVAHSTNKVIGKDNTLIWHLPADFKYFKQITSGHTIIMGRKTFESIGRPLPNRRNVIISRNPALKIEGCEVIHHIEEFERLNNPGSEIFFVGGGEIYELAMPYTDRLYVTEVHTEVQGDAFFPAIDPAIWKETAREDLQADEKNKLDYSFVVYDRINSGLGKMENSKAPSR